MQGGAISLFSFENKLLQFYNVFPCVVDCAPYFSYSAASYTYLVVTARNRSSLTIALSARLEGGRERQTDRQTDRRERGTEREGERQTRRETDRQGDRQTDRRERGTEREREREREEKRERGRETRERASFIQHQDGR